MSITFDSPEHDTMSGSACCVTVSRWMGRVYHRGDGCLYMSVLQIAVEKALRAVLSLNYHKASDTLVVHRYEMKSANEEVRNDVFFPIVILTKRYIRKTPSKTYYSFKSSMCSLTVLSRIWV